MSIKSTYGLVGYPLGHSLSPVMHNTAFKVLEVDAEYCLFPMKVEEVGPFLQALKAKDSHIFGLNVTVPHKEAVIPFLDSLDGFAQKAGAVNTIVIDDKRRLKGFNTDGPGFLAHLAEEGFNPSGKRVSILGAGGAARAIVASLSLINDKPELILIYDIDPDRVNALVRDLGTRINVSHVKVVNTIDELNIELADLLINATPIGMKDTDPCLVSEELLHSHLMVYDLVYNPAETKLLKLAGSRGARTVNGLKMLFYQGVLAFQRWADAELAEPLKKQMWDELYKACYKR